MKTPLKKLCLFGMLGGLGDTILSKSKDDVELWRAKKISELGRDLKAIGKVKVDKSSAVRSFKKIEEVYPHTSDPDPCEVLSFIFLGIFEMYIISGKPEYLNKALGRIKWVIQFYDPKLKKDDIHETALQKYFFWENY